MFRTQDWIKGIKKHYGAGIMLSAL